MDKGKFKFDDRYFKSYKRWSNIDNKLKDADELSRCLLEYSKDLAFTEVQNLKFVLDENINKLFEVCKYLKINEIYIEYDELVTTDVRCGCWPAVWKLVEILSNGGIYKSGIDFDGGSGNRFQMHTRNTQLFIPQGYIGEAWDVEHREMIPCDKFEVFTVATGTKCRT